MPDSSRVVSVEIRGQRYPIRSHLDPAYVVELAAYVDAKMQIVAEETPSGDAVRIAVLAALNIADEYFRARDAERLENGRLLRRAEDIERLVDEVLQRVATEAKERTA